MPFPTVQDIYSLAQGNYYPSQEGTRMVGLTSEALQGTKNTKAPKRKANVTDEASPSSSGMRRQTTLTQSATGQLGLQLPFEDAKVSDGFKKAKVNDGFFHCYHSAIKGK